ncbi:MAG: isopenicillin N synthase family dioxygenase [Candidatus Binatia bacterium]
MSTRRPAIFKKSQPLNDEDRIPVLDLGPFLAGESGALTRLGQDVRQALEDIGFFFINNHGVPPALIDRVFAENARFHALPLERKLSVKVNSKGIGYMPSGLQQPQYNQDELPRKPDIGEAFFLGREVETKTLDASTPDPLYQGGNQWPHDLPGFRETVIEYFDAMEALSLRLLPVYAAALGLHEHFFDDAFLHSRPLGILRLSHYPGTRCEENQFNASPHIDGDFLTFLAQSEVPGLELRTPEKKWIQAPALPGTFLVNAGEILRLWSNGRFRATLHRVINQSGRDRYAIPFFYSPSPDTLIECLETCCDADHPPQYRPVTVREYTEWFSHKVFVHLKDKPGRSPYYEGDRPDSAA